MKKISTLLPIGNLNISAIFFNTVLREFGTSFSGFFPFSLLKKWSVVVGGQHCVHAADGGVWAQVRYAALQFGTSLFSFHWYSLVA